MTKTGVKKRINSSSVASVQKHHANEKKKCVFSLTESSVHIFLRQAFVDASFQSLISKKRNKVSYSNVKKLAINRFNKVRRKKNGQQEQQIN